MIFEALLNMIASVLTGLFSILPSLPATPAILESTIDSIMLYINNGVSFFRYLLTPLLFNLTLSIIVAVMIFERGYNTIMFVLKKLPFLNIK